ncbi:G-protein coupled receptor 4 [Acipenser ruthenus]|uniref:G-protein coupled receptor 4 n=1 Tax=Acipenser ruthenus TaxID=7906 RepID=A0A444V7T0_ACIRT|nr:G-protein coupled receptor 4 [Acipenser ruthenus]
MMNNSSSNSCDNIDFSSDQTFLSVLYGIVFCIGLPTNCLALYGLYRLVKTDNALPVYVINLLLSDLLQISTLPLWIDYYSHGHVWRYDRTACVFVCVISNISLYSSIFFLCCISLERYLAIAHPLWYRNLHPHKLAAVTCVGLWVVVTLVVLMDYHIGLGTVTDPQCSEHYPRKWSYAMFQLFLKIFTFPLPLFLLVFVHRRTRMSLADSLSVSAEEKERISRLLALVVIIFILVFGPHHLIVFGKCIGLIVLVENCGFEARIFLCYQISSGLLSLNSLLDPVLYIFVCRDVRKEMLESFPCFRNAIKLWRELRADQDGTSVSTSPSRV